MSQTNELKSERFQMFVEKSTLEAVDDWGFSNRIRTRAEAIRQLIHLGLDAAQPQTKKADAASQG